MKSDFFRHATSFSNQLSNIILLSGNEPYQKEKIVQTLLTIAESRQLEVVRHTVENKLEAEWLYESSGNMSLFNDKRLFLIRFNKLPEATTQKLLASYFEKLSQDDVFVFIFPRLPAKSQKQVWYKNLEKIGIYIPVWQPNIKDALRILKYKTTQDKLQIDHDALLMMTHNYEGNMLAACQLLDKLAASILDRTIELEDVKKQVHQANRYDVFSLTEVLLMGDPSKALQILQTLKSSGTETPIILWSLAKEARLISKLVSAQDRNEQQKLFQANQIWQAKQKNYFNAINRLNNKQLYAILQQCHQIDLIIKGAKTGNVWENIQKACLMFVPELALKIA